ncbi:MAG TPA: hypothetical protein VE591_02385 [Candidatus Acidoferrum sp.]|nr:hypothetical protein [Candidatus Acidoferrum sp.]
MKCCGSQTTFNAADPRIADQRRAAEQIAQSLIFREVLRPLAQGLGPVGEIAIGNVADALFTGKPR